MGEESKPGMAAYATLAAWYRLIFPLSPKQEAFFESLRSTGEVSSVLDVGAGVGEQLAWFSARGIGGTALEPDEDMFGQLKSREWPGPPPELVRAGIESLPGEWTGRFGLILCLGNTLPHLPDAKAIRDAFAGIRAALKEGGRLALQTVNFDLILAEGKASFPVIERRSPAGVMVRFLRSYDLREAPRRILFSVRLEVEERVTTAEWPLTPVARGELVSWLRMAGFVAVETYGDYDLSPFGPASPALIMIAS